MTNPLVSIVLSSYNQPELLDIAFSSLINQTYKNIEIIIVDDCSPDRKNKDLILNYYNRYPDIVRYVIHSKNIGIAKNKNSGFRLAKGELITYLDGDDFYFPEKIEKEVLFLENQPSFEVVYSNFVFADFSGQVIKKWAENQMPTGIIFNEVVTETIFPEAILFRFEMMRASVFKKHGYYDEELKIYEDWDIKIRYSVDCKVGYVNEALSAYRRTSESITIRSTFSQVTLQKKKVIEKNKLLIESYPGFGNYYKNSIQALSENILFDTKVTFFAHVIGLIKFVSNNPSKLFVAFKAFNYYIKKQ